MRSSWRRALTAGLVASAAAIPPVAEAAVDARLAEDGGELRAHAVRIGLGNVHLKGVTVQRGAFTVAAEAIDLNASPAGVGVGIHGALITRDGGPAPEAPSAAEASGDGSTSAWREWIAKLPVTVTAADTVHVSSPEAELQLARAAAYMTGTKLDRVEFEGEVEHPSGAWAVEAQLLNSENPTAHGTLKYEGKQAKFAARREGERDARRWRVALEEASGGRLRADLHDGRLSASVHGLSGLWLDAHLPPEAADSIDLSDARLSGDVTASRRDGTWRADFERARVEGLRVAHGKIARDTLELLPTKVGGQIRWSPAERTARADLRVQHGRIDATVSGQSTADGLTVHLGLAETPCQGLLEDAPMGLLPALQGMRFGGSVGGTLALSFEYAAIREALEAQRAAGEAAPLPGNLAVDFPFLESCPVERDPAYLDADRLRGPYRHRFTTAGGTPRERVLAIGSEGYVPLGRVEHLGRAFVTTEDSRFWHHDGFDRDQMVRAFWFNVASDRIGRGASTITQQTARNLWLGTERNLSRKLQEAVLASRLEALIGKRRILEIYLNIIELGPEVHGVQEAARYHFGKNASDLGLLESLFISALAPAPAALSKRFHSDGIDPQWLAHLRHQARRMHLHHLIGASELKAGLWRKPKLRKG